MPNIKGKNKMEIQTVNENNLEVYINLGQPYSAEFAPLTRDLPNKQGKFRIDSPITPNGTGYLLYIDGLPAGLTSIGNVAEGKYEIYEFYVLPFHRKQKVGKDFAHMLFDMLPGEWVSKQIAGADHAVSFWRRVIGEYTNEQYTEDMYQDAHWGLVTRQTFTATAR